MKELKNNYFIINILNNRYVLYLIFAIIIGFYCYYGALDNYFYIDDGMWITDMKILRHNVYDVFNTTRMRIRTTFFFPHIIYYLLLDVGKWNPMLFYLTAIILRILISFLFFALVYRYTKKAFISVCVSLIFLVNFSTFSVVFLPSNIAYWSGLLFYVLTLIVFLSDLEAKNIFKLFCFFGFYIAAILSHENAVTLPFICFVASLIYNYENEHNSLIQLFKLSYRFLRRYLLSLIITIAYLAFFYSKHNPNISFLRLFNVILSLAKSTLLWFVPEGNLVRLISLLNNLFSINTTFNIQTNVFLTVISLCIFFIFLSISVIILFNFFIKRKKQYALLMVVGFLITIINICPYAMSYGSVFPPSRILYYPSFGFSLVIASAAMIVYDWRVKRITLLRYIFYACAVGYVIIAINVNKKIESAFHHDTNIARIAYLELKKKMSIFPSGSNIYFDLSSVNFKLYDSQLAQFVMLIPELLDNEPPFAGLSFTINFINQNIKNQLFQIFRKSIREDCKHPVFYFELVNNKLIMYQWDSFLRNFILKDENLTTS